MILYHGSDVIVEHPDILHSQQYLDFGIGFYTTSLQLQAERWAKRKAMLHGKNIGHISIYEITEAPGFVVCDFDDDLYSWIDFVCKCRFGSDIFRQYDIIKGKVADDKVIRVVDMYMRKLIDKDTAIREIKIYEAYDQIAYITQKSIDACLKFKASYEVTI